MVVELVLVMEPVWLYCGRDRWLIERAVCAVSPLRASGLSSVFRGLLVEPASFAPFSVPDLEA